MAQRASAKLVPFPSEEADPREEIWIRLTAAEGFTELGMFAEAHAELAQLDEKSSFQLEIAARKLPLLVKEKNWKEALVYGEIMTEFLEDEPEHFILYATALHAVGRTEGAIELLLEDAPSRIERDPDCQLQIAGYNLALGKRRGALFHLENAVALDLKFLDRARRDPALAPLVAELPEVPKFESLHWIEEPEEGDEFGFDDEPDSDEDFDCPF